MDKLNQAHIYWGGRKTPFRRKGMVNIYIKVSYRTRNIIETNLVRNPYFDMDFYRKPSFVR